MTDDTQRQHGTTTAAGGTSNTLVTLIGLGLIAGLGAAMFMRSGGSGNPEAANAIFEQGEAGTHMTYAEVREQATEAGKPVFVLATADWCGPCQQLKGNTLSDEGVQGLLAERAMSYKLDVTDQSTMSPEDQKLAGELGVMGIPAYYLIDDGQVIAKGSGYQDAGGFTRWLEAATGE